MVQLLEEGGRSGRQIGTAATEQLLQNMASELEQKTTEVAEAAATKEGLLNEINSKDANIAALEEKDKELTSTIAELDETDAGHNTKIGSLQVSV